MIEIQVRTPLQHLWAELSEKLSDVVDPSIKYGGGDDEIRRVLIEASDLVTAFETYETKVVRLPEQRIPDKLRQELLELRRGMVELKNAIVDYLTKAISEADDLDGHKP